MIRLGIAIFLATLVTAAHAQLSSGGCKLGDAGLCSPLVSAAGPSYTGPGDIVSGAYAFWSCTRGYNSTAASNHANACLIERASDNTQTTLTVQSNGTVTSPATFCNATICSVVTAYDQTGNSNDVTQSTAADQPSLTISCQNSLPCMAFTSARLLEKTSSVSTQAQPTTFYVVGTDTTANDAGPVLASGTGGSTYNAFWWNPELTFFTLVGYSGSFTDILSQSFSGGPEVGVWCGCYFINQGGTGNAFVVFNATASSTVSGVSTSVEQALALGADAVGDPGPAHLVIGEAGIWPSAFNSTQYGNVTTNVRSYWGF